MYGRRLHCSWFYRWRVACLVLQVTFVHAEFDASDSDTLYDIYSRVDDIAEDVELMKTRSSDWSFIRGHLQEIDDALNPGGRLYGMVGSIASSASASAASLVNIESAATATANGISSLSDMLDSRLLGISNAIASIPRCNVVVTNLLTSSGNVDMGVVTNLVTYLFSFQDVADWGDFSGFPYYDLLYMYFHKLWGEDFFSMEDFKAMWANSPLGFMLYLYQSALFRSGLGITGLDSFDVSWGVWQSGEFFSMPSPDFTIFDAYNTIPLGRITNQLDDVNFSLSVITNQLNNIYTYTEGSYKSFQGFLNYFYRHSHNVTNALNVIINLIQNNGSYIREKVSSIESSIGYDENLSEADLEYPSNWSLPEWEETFKGHIDDWTNGYYYSQIFQHAIQKMGDVTNSVNDFFDSVERAGSSGSPSFYLSWSGVAFPGMNNVLGGWDLKVDLSSDDQAYSDLRELVSFAVDLFFWVLDAFLVYFYLKRIYERIVHPHFE